jgi:hypothetical protein
MRKWEIVSTTEFDEWFEALNTNDRRRIFAIVAVLEEMGPALGRPAVDSIETSRHSNMKELRPGTMRVLFAFDPERNAVLLIGGDKRDQWKRWYREMIPVADDLFDEHLRRVRRRNG